MWIHIGILMAFCVLFLISKGFFSKSGACLASRFPDFLPITEKQIRFFLILLFCSNLLGLGVSVLQSRQEDTVPEGYVVRPGQGEGSYKEELVVSDGRQREQVTVEIKEEPYSEKELRQMLEEAVDTMDQAILGENKNFARVEYPLKLMTAVENTPITIEWNSSQPIYLDWEGNLGEEIPEEGAAVQISALLTAGKYTREYEQTVTAFPEKLTKEEAFMRTADREARQYAGREGRYQYLPEEIEGRAVKWTRPQTNTGLWIVGFAAVTGILLILSGLSRKKQKEKEQTQQMLLDYPNIISKLILLMQAGASSRRALKKIALDYKYDMESGGGKRQAYEEILRTYYEMEHGISEEEAYANLGSRCEILEYRTLSTLLVQNLKKGSSQFVQALEQECVQAFEERKKRALILGEEAGTKLLLPMGCMLMIVLLILIVPSFMSF